MARPRSEEKRGAILAAATGLLAEQGLGVPTAEIAKRAKLPHGSVFTYFPTKVELFNALYVELKTQLSDTIMRDMPAEIGGRARLRHLWNCWTAWGVAHPHERRALAHLAVSDQISPSSRKAAADVAAEAVDVVRLAAAEGALALAPMAYAGALVEAMVWTTTDFMTRDAANAALVRDAGFEALWQALR